MIKPSPSSAIVFGSMAKGGAGSSSDIDVLIVRSHDVGDDDPEWSTSLGQWSDEVQAITGNPVNLLVIAEQSLPELLQRPNSVWREILSDGIALWGTMPHVTEGTNS
jgi:predicted nucleotidyltransferase